MPEKIFLVDAYALIFRSYYAFIRTPMHNSEGFNTSILHGFLSTVIDLLKKENPSHLIVAFDDDKPSFRRNEYKEYKANRPKTPEDIKASVPVLKKFLKAMDINYIQEETYEADDVIGSLAKKAAANDFQVYMFTSDKDFYQLLDKNIAMYKPRSRATGYEIITEKDILEKYGFRSVKNFIDILALWGDSADNIPGARGIGEKGAQQLVAEYGSVEEIYSHLEEIPAKFRNKLIESKENVFLSKKLATIITDIDLDINFDLFRVKKFSTEKVMPLLMKYELRNVASKLGGFQIADKSHEKPKVDTKEEGQLSFFSEKETATPVDSFEDTKTNYKMIEDLTSLNQILTRIRQIKRVAYNIIYTDTVNRFEAEMLAVSLALNEDEVYFIPVDSKSPEGFADAVFELFKDDTITKIGYHTKNDFFIFKYQKKPFRYPVFDIFIAHYLINPDERHGLDYLAQKYLNYQLKTAAKFWNKKGEHLFNDFSPYPQDLVDFACERADAVFRIFSKLSAEITKNHLGDLLQKIELPLIEVLAEMEANGVSLDLVSLKSIEDDLKKQLSGIQDKIYSLAGEEFNIASARQLGIILFEKLNINKGKKRKLTKTKQYSTSEETLLKIKNEHEIIELVLSFRTLTKLLNTYIEALPKLINPKTGKIHTYYNQAVANTGRLSSANPNLQNIPIKDEQGKAIRRSFIPEMPSAWFVSADYSQIELRILAEYSKDPHLVEAFLQNMDVHTATACKIFKVKPENVTPLMRKKAKVANFGIIYGISAFGLSERLQIPRSESKELIEGYFENFPTVKDYIEKAKETARKNGYAQTFFGRRKYLPDINSSNHVVRSFAERNAINMPIQGTAADIIKMAMINIHRELKAQHLKAKMIMQVHDELCFDVPHTELGIVRQLITEKMENVYAFSVPLKVDLGVGKNWLEAH